MPAPTDSVTTDSATTDPAAVGAFAIWGSTDLPGLGDQLLSRVTEQQLTARLPGWSARRFAPLGWTRPITADGGWIAAPLAGQPAEPAVVCPGFPVGEPAAALVRRYGDERAADAVAYFGGEIGSPVWSGVRISERPVASIVDAVSRPSYLAVRDPVSRERLRSAGVERDIAVVPHPGLLVGSLVSQDLLNARRQALRQLGLLPDKDYLVVQDAELTETAQELLADTDTAAVVALPTDLVFEDRLATLAGATVVIATDEHGAAAAAGLGRRWVLLDVTGADRPVALEFGYAKQIVDTPAKLRAAVRATAKLAPRKDKALAAVSTHFDRVASEVTVHSGHTDRPAGELAAENAALRAAHDRLRQRMFVERQRLVEPLAQAELGQLAAERETANVRAELARARAELAPLAERNRELVERVADLDREVLAWRSTKLVRWTDPVRRAYGKMLGQ
ncbi:MAG TPA: hypothetical protein VG317_09545 [Pseudonocardiaceae bacterium]|nr:hypothetical protein [Pseudonocardiaceae bacterium]